MAKKNLTKKQYTRKRVFAAVGVFVVLAVVVSGVAVALLFGQIARAAGGGMTVAQVAMSPLAFSSFRIDGVEIGNGDTAPGFTFDAQKDDDEGRVSWDGSSCEKMSIAVSGVITNAQHLRSVTYSLTLPEGVVEAAQKGYLDISQVYDMETGLAKVVGLSLTENGTMLADGAGQLWRFEFEVAIGWGEFFRGMNPSVYYDTAGFGLDVPLQEVLEVLHDLRETVHRSSVTPMYTLTVTATPN